MQETSVLGTLNLRVFTPQCYLYLPLFASKKGTSLYFQSLHIYSK